MRKTTAEYKKSYQNVKVNTGEFFGFGPTKNLAATLAKTEWILSIDSDEVVTPELLEEIKKLDLSNQNSVYKINRQNLFMKCPVNYSGWNPDWIVRIYNKNIHHFVIKKFMNLYKYIKIPMLFCLKVG